MALQANINYKGIDLTEVYVKIENIRVSKVGFKVVDFSAIVTYSIKVNKDAEVFTIEELVFSFNPDLSIYLQAYDELKKLYPKSTDI